MGWTSMTRAPTTSTTVHATSMPRWPSTWGGRVPGAARLRRPQTAYAATAAARTKLTTAAQMEKFRASKTTCACGPAGCRSDSGVTPPALAARGTRAAPVITPPPPSRAATRRPGRGTHPIAGRTNPSAATPSRRTCYQRAKPSRGWQSCKRINPGVLASQKDARSRGDLVSLHQPGPEREPHGRDPAVDPQLAEDGLDVVADGRRAEAQVVGDCACAVPGRQQPEDFLLAARQRGGRSAPPPARERCWLAALPVGPEGVRAHRLTLPGHDADVAVGVAEDVPALVPARDQRVASLAEHLGRRVAQELLRGTVPEEDPPREVHGHHAVGRGPEELQWAPAPLARDTGALAGHRATPRGSHILENHTPRRHGRSLLLRPTARLRPIPPASARAPAPPLGREPPGPSPHTPWCGGGRDTVKVHPGHPYWCKCPIAPAGAPVGGSQERVSCVRPLRPLRAGSAGGATALLTRGAASRAPA